MSKRLTAVPPQVIATMGHQSWVRTDTTSVSSASRNRAFLGAMLFMLSDSILAWNKFRDPTGLKRPDIPHAKLWVMITYYAAQVFIGLSVVGEKKKGEKQTGAKSKGD